MKLRFKHLLGACSLLALGLLVIRVLHSSSLSYAFLAWNLFLAFVPLWISRFLGSRKELTVWHLPLMAAWLLFLPNAPYILTDLFHFRPRPGVPFWYDLALITWFACLGLVAFYRSVMLMRQVFLRYIQPAQLQWLMPPLFGLVAFGLYLGRFLRFNSWDIIHPFRLAKASMHTLLTFDALAFTGIFAVLLWIGYGLVESVGQKNDR